MLAHRFQNPGWDADATVESRDAFLHAMIIVSSAIGVVVVEPLQAREQLVVDVAARVRNRVGVFERHLFRFR